MYGNPLSQSYVGSSKKAGLSFGLSEMPPLMDLRQALVLNRHSISWSAGLTSQTP